MDFLDCANVSFLSNSSIGRLFEDLNNIVGQGIWYDTFQVQNTKWLWLVNDIVTTMNSDKVLCGCFGLYSSYVVGILKSVKEIHFYVLCSKKLHYDEYIEKCIAGNKCSVSYTKHTENTFHLSSSSDDSVIVPFEARFIHDELPSELIFTQSVLKRIQLFSLTYGIVIVDKHITCIIMKQ
jgi:hypothetical protein